MIRVKSYFRSSTYVCCSFTETYQMQTAAHDQLQLFTAAADEPPPFAGSSPTSPA